MTSEATEAELRRMLSGEKDLELNCGHAPPTPPNSGDTGCLVHVGAHFGPSNDFCPSYPDYVELEGEAARQPDPRTPREHHAYRVQHSPERGPQHLPPTPTLTPKQKGPYLSRSEYILFERLHLEKEARGQRITRSQSAHDSCPTHSREPSLGTVATNDDHASSTSMYQEYASDHFPKHDTPLVRADASTLNEPPCYHISPLQRLSPSESHIHDVSQDEDDGLGDQDMWQRMGSP